MLAWRFSLSLLFLVLTGCGGIDDTCFSPEQNVNEAYDEGAIGCGCDDSKDRGQCVTNDTGRKVALVCEAGRWTAVEDGPCAPDPH